MSRSSAWWSQAVSNSSIKGDFAWVGLVVFGLLTAIWNLKVWDSLGHWYNERDYYMKPKADEEMPQPIPLVEMDDMNGRQDSAEGDTAPTPPPYTIFPDPPISEQAFNASGTAFDEPAWPPEAHTPQSSPRPSGSTPGQNISRDPEPPFYIPIPIPNDYQPTPPLSSQPLPNDTRRYHRVPPTDPRADPISKCAGIIYFILFFAALAPAVLTWLLPVKIRDWEFENACLSDKTYGVEVHLHSAALDDEFQHAKPMYSHADFYELEENNSKWGERRKRFSYRMEIVRGNTPARDVKRIIEGNAHPVNVDGVWSFEETQRGPLPKSSKYKSLDVDNRVLYVPRMDGAFYTTKLMGEYDPSPKWPFHVSMGSQKDKQGLRWGKWHVDPMTNDKIREWCRLPIGRVLDGNGQEVMKTTRQGRDKVGEMRVCVKTEGKYKGLLGEGGTSDEREMGVRVVVGMLLERFEKSVSRMIRR